MLSTLRAAARSEVLGDDAALEETLGQLVNAARSAWPEVSLSPRAFATHLGARLPAGEPPREALGAVQAADLYLAAACLAGDPAALGSFEERLVSRIPFYLRSMRLSTSTLEEVTQVVRERIFVGSPEGGPRLAEYAGRGSLEGWFRVVVFRTATNLRIGERRHRPAARPLEERILEADGDLELEYIRNRYRHEFEAAFAEALGTLTPRERSVLRFYLVDGLTLEQIGAVRGVHASTVSRWLAVARRRVRDEATRLIRERLGSSDSEIESLLGLLRSHLDVSIIERLQSC